MFPLPSTVCAVCAGGYTAGLSYTCSKCSADRRHAVIASAGVLLFAVAVAAVALGVKHLRRSGARETQERRPPSRTMKILQSCFKRIMGSPALKIVIVAWQIVSQASAILLIWFSKRNRLTVVQTSKHNGKIPAQQTRYVSFSLTNATAQRRLFYLPSTLS